MSHQQQQPLLEQQEEETTYDSSEKVVVVGIDEEEAYEADVDSEVWIPPFSWKKLRLFSGSGFLMSIVFLGPWEEIFNLVQFMGILCNDFLCGLLLWGFWLFFWILCGFMFFNHFCSFFLLVWTWVPIACHSLVWLVRRMQ